MTEKSLPEDLADNLQQFIGTETWWQYPLMAGVTYTDGVKYFCDHAGAYWLLDILATEGVPLARKHGFVVFHFGAHINEGALTADDGNGHVLLHKKIGFTDCPPGTWTFFIVDDVIMLPSEY